MHPRLDRVYRPHPHRFQRLVTQLAPVVFAHTALSRKRKIESANYGRSRTAFALAIAFSSAARQSAHA
jgi:hypothetical protein